jgi:acyl CoA:acetate/3-ketoacid CoA transferase beta subunit
VKSDSILKSGVIYKLLRGDSLTPHPGGTGAVKIAQNCKEIFAILGHCEAAASYIHCLRLSFSKVVDLAM